MRTRTAADSEHYGRHGYCDFAPRRPQRRRRRFTGVFQGFCVQTRRGEFPWRSPKPIPSSARPVGTKRSIVVLRCRRRHESHPITRTTICTSIQPDGQTNFPSNRCRRTLDAIQSKSRPSHSPSTPIADDPPRSASHGRAKRDRRADANPTARPSPPRRPSSVLLRFSPRRKRAAASCLPCTPVRESCRPRPQRGSAGAATG